MAFTCSMTVNWVHFMNIFIAKLTSHLKCFIAPPVNCKVFLFETKNETILTDLRNIVA